MRASNGTILIVVSSAASILCGCVDRTERLQMDARGAVTMTIDHRADQSSENAPGMAPCEAGGWLVTQREEEVKPGETKYILHAERTVEPEQSMPFCYADPNDPEADLYLQFPTFVYVRDKEEGNYYHFRRTYRSRPWSFINAEMERRAAELGELAGKDPKSMQPEERQRMVRVLAESLAYHLKQFARRAIDVVAPEISQIEWGNVMRQVDEAVESLDVRGIAARWAEPGVGAVAADAASFDKTLNAQLDEGLKRFARFDANALEIFHVALAREKKQYEITQQLGGHTFHIHVELPGQITGSNADSIDGSTATWTIKGDAFRDHDIELFVTSRISR